MLAGQRRRKMRGDGQFIVRLAGVVFAVLANLFLVWVLLNDLCAAPDFQESDDTPLQVQWIEANTPEIQAVERPIAQSPQSQRSKKTLSVREIEVQPPRNDVPQVQLPSLETSSPPRGALSRGMGVTVAPLVPTDLSLL